jgi:hypothetical protein
VRITYLACLISFIPTVIMIATNAVQRNSILVEYYGALVWSPLIYDYTVYIFEILFFSFFFFEILLALLLCSRRLQPLTWQKLQQNITLPLRVLIVVFFSYNAFTLWIMWYPFNIIRVRW